MEINKYENTMYQRFDSKLTDRMLAADTLVKKLVYIKEHSTAPEIASHIVTLKKIDQCLSVGCNDLGMDITDLNSDAVNCVRFFNSIVYRVKNIYNKIYVNWLSGEEGNSLMFANSINEIENVIATDPEFVLVLSGGNFCPKVFGMA